MDLTHRVAVGTEGNSTVLPVSHNRVVLVQHIIQATINLGSSKVFDARRRIVNQPVLGPSAPNIRLLPYTK